MPTLRDACVPCLPLAARRLSLGLHSPQPTIAGGNGEQDNIARTQTPVTAFNFSMDPWECTGAAPQGWATHLQQSLLPVQGYLHLRPSNAASLPSFGAPCTDSSALVPAQEQLTQEVTRRQGRASRPVSIFARAPVCV